MVKKHIVARESDKEVRKKKDKRCGKKNEGKNKIRRESRRMGLVKMMKKR